MSVRPTGALAHVSDQRIGKVTPLATPALMLHEQPLGEAAAAVVLAGRSAVTDILAQLDDRLLVVVGPCSVHDPVAAMDYARLLAAKAHERASDLFIVMRVYFEKPRTTTGWKGLINDPHLDNSGDVSEGLRLARRLLLEVLDLGLAVGCEFLDPIIPQYIADTVTWGAIGARTTESQIHRELASGLSMPVGFKNGTDGNIKVAVDAVRAARVAHTFTGVERNGTPAILETTGNDDAHIILRGGRVEPNYDAAAVAAALDQLEAAGLPRRVIVDASHENSRKDHTRQPHVASDVAKQIAGGNDELIGVMLESFLVEGNQDLGDGSNLTYGQSITDSCMSWETTATVLDELADAVRQRRTQR